MLVTAGAGAGKSRLRHELLRALRERGLVPEVWMARGDPIAAGSAFGTLAQLLRGVAGLFDGEIPEVRRQKLLARIGRNLRVEDATRVAQFLGEIVRAEFTAEGRPALRAARNDPTLMNDQLRLAWEDLVAAETAAGPLVIVLEDLQWGDLPSIRFIDSALRTQRHRPLFVLALARPEVHDVYREWRKLLDRFDGHRMLVGEVWTDSVEDLARYVRGDELHQCFNFAWLEAPWDAAAFRGVIDDTLAALGAAPTWVLSNHDVVRHVTRYAEGAPEPGVGAARARAAVLAMLALPGSVYLYQGEELGLPEVKDLPPEVRQDPTFFRTGGEVPGRDGCRVPLPWSGSRPPFGFSLTGSAAPWLPQPADWAELTVERQLADPESMLSFYRRALALRRSLVGALPARVTWLDSPDEVLAFARGDLICVLNCGRGHVALPPHRAMLAASGPLTADGLPPDTAAWLAAR